MSTNANQFYESLVDEITERVLERITGSTDLPAAKRLMTMKEAGEYMGGKTAAAVRHMVNSGVIPPGAVKRFSARRVLLDRVELDKWIVAQ